MPDDSDFEERLAGLEQPPYLAISLTDDGEGAYDLSLSTNLSDQNDIIRVLAQAIAYMADDPDWTPLT